MRPGKLSQKHLRRVLIMKAHYQKHAGSGTGGVTWRTSLGEAVDRHIHGPVKLLNQIGRYQVAWTDTHMKFWLETAI